MKTPSSSFKSIPPPADPRYPAANALYSTRPAVGEAAHTPTLRSKGPAFRMANQDWGVDLLNWLGLSVVRVTAPTKNEAESRAAFIVLACNENAKLHADNAALVAALKAILHDHANCVACEQPGFLTDSQVEQARAALNAAKS